MFDLVLDITVWYFHGGVNSQLLILIMIGKGKKYAHNNFNKNFFFSNITITTSQQISLITRKQSIHKNKSKNSESSSSFKLAPVVGVDENLDGVLKLVHVYKLRGSNAHGNAEMVFSNVAVRAKHGSQWVEVAFHGVDGIHSQLDLGQMVGGEDASVTELFHVDGHLVVTAVGLLRVLGLAVPELKNSMLNIQKLKKKVSLVQKR